MDPRLKQRLVGAAVLLALAVIFLPMVLDGGGRDADVSVRDPVPAEPEFARPAPPPPLPLDDLPEALPEETRPAPSAEARNVPSPEPTPRIVTVPDPVRSPPVEEARPSPAASPEGPGGFAVQVGSFSEQGSARAERDRLQQAGYTVFVEPVQVQGREFFRVKLGPVGERAEAERLRDRVRQREGIDNAIVITHP